MKMSAARLSNLILPSAVGLAFACQLGCAAAQLRTTPTTSGIRAAEEVGASSVPKASLHLQLAREELARAQALSEDGEHEQADSMLLRAEVDAELAVILARENAERAQANKAMARVQELRDSNASSN